MVKDMRDLWLCRIYNARGQLGEAAWAKFAEYCEQNGLTVEPPPGRRLDGKDPWDVLATELFGETEY